MNAWERPTQLGFSYADVRGMDNAEIIKAGLESGDRLAYELANRLDNALGPTGEDPKTEAQRNYESHDTRMSDSSLYDEICKVCGARDYAIGPNELTAKPCTVKA